MAFASLLFVVLASLIHASWNLLAKRAASVGPIFVFAYNMIACVAYAPWVVYLFIEGNGIVWTRISGCRPVGCLSHRARHGTHAFINRGLPDPW